MTPELDPALVPEDLVPRLMSEFHYSERGARLVAEDMARCAPQIRSIFVRWWREGEIEDTTICGYTIERLRSEHGMNVVAALLTLDWLIKDPTEAQASLERGHDLPA